MRWPKWMAYRKYGKHTAGRHHQPCIEELAPCEKDDRGVVVGWALGRLAEQITVADIAARDGHITATLPDGSRIEGLTESTADKFAEHFHFPPVSCVVHEEDLEYRPTAGDLAARLNAERLDEFRMSEAIEFAAASPLRFTLDAAPPPRGMIR